MRRICAWCGKDLDEREAQGSTLDAVSHGLCDDCYAHVTAEMGVPLGEYLDWLDVPVLVMDGEASVRTANVAARELLDKGLTDIERHRCGEVFECAHARLPEGCGSTIHCSGCAIRRAVLETYRTGQRCLRVPAYLAPATPGQSSRIALLISTQRVTSRGRSVVLLRIDEMGSPTT
jgi:hypothetical protein